MQALASDPKKLAQFRAEVEAVLASYYDPEWNFAHQGFLMTRATKA